MYLDKRDSCKKLCSLSCSFIANILIENTGVYNFTADFKKSFHIISLKKIKALSAIYIHILRSNFMTK